MYSRYLSRWGALALALAMLLVAPALASAGALAYYGQNETLESGGLLGGQDLGAAYEQGSDVEPDDEMEFTAWQGAEAAPELKGLTSYDASADPLAQPVEGLTSGGDTLNANFRWWYFFTGEYRVFMPGTAEAPLASYRSMAYAIRPYLDSGYTAAKSVLGLGTSYYINIFMRYDSSRQSVGWYNPGYGSFSINLNFAHGQSVSQWGSTVAHETNHLLLDNATNLFNRYGVDTSWLFEALAYYTGHTVYQHGYKRSFAYNSSYLKLYSRNGAKKSSWYDSGWRYMVEGMTGLDYCQLNTIGMFLASSQKGISAVRDTVTQLINGADVDTAFARSYGGLTSGQYSIASGAGVNTLYSKYQKFYLGHY